MNDLTNAANTSTPGGPDERYMVPGLTRGLAMLSAFTAERPALSLAELARAVGLTRSSAFRIAYTLAELGYLVRDETTKSYRLGPRVLGLGFAFLASIEILEIAQPHLVALRDRTQCSAHLAVLDGSQIVYVARHADQKALTSRIQVGSRLPAHATSMGRAILSQLSPEDVRARFKDTPLEAFSKTTATTLDDLIAQLARDRAQGHVLGRSNFERGIASVAAPIFDAEDAVIAAINITTPESTLSGDDLETRMRDAVVETAATISEWLGHRGARRSA
ncbi:MAG TPA: IclR family transcriptional regulator [Alphaproteobacteria bacterium]|nr:IclR family transcriptional regulator [Alphaproteobacteria bacterium]